MDTNQEIQIDPTQSRLDKIINASCLTEIPFLSPDSIDLVVFSPPYDGIRDYKKNWQFDYHALGVDLFRVVKDGGVCTIVMGDGTKDFAKSLSTFRLAVDWCDQIGWRMFETCIYKRDGNPGAWWNNRFRVDHEYILMFFKGKRPATFQKEHLMVPSKHAGRTYSGTDRLTNGGFKRIVPKTVNPLKCRGTVWPYSTSNTEGNKLKLKHPATFPDKLAEDLMLCFSKPDEIVLDPMCGSGTTCAMALRNNRHFIGTDIAEEYCNIARERVLLEEQQLRSRLF